VRFLILRGADRSMLRRSKSVRSVAGSGTGQLLMNILTRFSTIFLAVCCACPGARSADLYQYEVSELKAPDCLQDVSGAFFSQNDQQTEPIHPVLPVSNFYLLVRYLGDNAIGAAPSFDFARFPDTYGDPSIRGWPLTNLSVPGPKSSWQRASRPDATMDNSSAFQVHCFDAASFINTWTFSPRSIEGGGPHAIYGYSFNSPPPPAIFDGNPATDFVLQASIEIPWFARWTDPAALASEQPIAQVNLFAYFRDRYTGKTFALLLAIFDNRVAASPTYPSFVAHDGGTPFVSMPLNNSAVYATLSPYSSTYVGVPWVGLRFFRAHVTQDNFRRALADINVYCGTHSAARSCGPAPLIWTAYSSRLQDYELTDFGVIHEISRGSPGGNLSMAVHVYGLGAWNFR
jgi:hypothetical protein